MKLQAIKNIQKAYKSLNLIVFRDKYLIPQKPFPPGNLSLQYQKKFKAKIIEQIPNYDKLKSKQKISKFHEALKIKKQNDPIYLQMMQRKQKQIQEFKQKQISYKQKYLKPLTFYTSLNPYLYFIQDKFRESKLQNKKISINQISKMWGECSVIQKQKFFLKAQQERLKFLDGYNEFISRHKIPKRTNNTLLASIYIQLRMKQQKDKQQKGNTEQNQINVGQQSSAVQPASTQKDKNKNVNRYRQLFKKLAEQLKTLSEDQKQKYIKIAKQRKLKADKQFDKFLQRWGLKYDQFKYIASVSKIYDQIVRDKKKQRKMAKYLKKYSKVTQQPQSESEEANNLNYNEEILDVINQLQKQ